MTTAGRTPGVNHAKKVREYFEANRNRDIMLGEIRLIVGDGEGGMADPAKTRGVVNYLRIKKGMKITVVKRGEVWRYNKKQRTHVRVPRHNVTVSDQVDAYIADGKPIDSDEQAAVRLRRIADKLGKAEAKEEVRRSQETMAKWMGATIVPDTEPVVTLKVIGTLKETGEVLVKGDSAQGFERGVWALRKLV
jgi:hypothetical protein